MKYMVMECYLSHAIVLSEDGQVLKVANMNYTVGEMVDNVFLMKEKEKPTYLQTKVIAPILILATAFIIMISTTSIFNPNFATIIIDINPKVALKVNKDNTVAKITAKNEDGKDLIDGYEHQNKTLEVVTEELIERAIDKGYLSSGGSIRLVFDSKNQQWIVEKTELIKNHLAQHISDKLEISITITNSRTHETNIITPNPQRPPSESPNDDTDYTDYDDDGDDNDFDETDYDDSDYDDNDDTDDDDDDSDYEN